MHCRHLKFVNEFSFQLRYLAGHIINVSCPYKQSNNPYNLSRVVRKPDFCQGENKGADTAKLISAFVFATRIVHFLYFLYPKFPVSGHLLCLYSSVCVGPGRKPRRPVFSHRGSFHGIYSSPREIVLKQDK